MSPGSLSFAKLVIMSSAPAKSAGDARYASQDPFIHSLSHTILTPICIRSAFFLRRMQLYPSGFEAWQFGLKVWCSNSITSILKIEERLSQLFTPLQKKA